MSTPLLQKRDCAHDFDHHGPDFARDPVGLTNAARQVCPITWSARYGGFWHVTGYEEAFTLLQDDEAFSSADGVSIPPLLKKGPPIDVDPPLHRRYRQALDAGTSRRRVGQLESQVRTWTTEAIDSVLEAGVADAVQDIAAPVPSKAILLLLGLPLSDWRRYADIWHDVLAHPQDPTVYESLQVVRREVFAAFGAKQRCPAGDMMSDIWASGLLECPGITDGFPDGLIGVGGETAMTLLGAGLDTTTNMFAQTVLWLSRHPDERSRLSDPGLLKTAVDEFFRYFSTAPALARTVTKDLEFFDHKLERGDRVLVSFLGANHDPRMFDEASELLIDRWPNRHMAFGVGKHRCLGSNLARLVFPIMLSEFLDRLPTFEVVTEMCEPYADRAQVAGWVRMPIRFPSMAAARR